MIKVKKIAKTLDTISESGNEFSLVLFNDDFNTFEFVIKTLIDVCDHTEEQAYQCAIVTHNNGKCEIKKGSGEDMRHRCSILLIKGLSVEVFAKG